MLWFVMSAALAAAPAPSGPTEARTFQEITLGDDHACGRTADGHVACWGRNDRGQLGPDAPAWTESPALVPLPAPATSLAAGDRHTCAVLRDATVACWGDNLSGQLGGAAEEISPNAVIVAGLTGVRQVAAGATHTCALGLDGSVSCWGNNLFGQSGPTRQPQTSLALPVPGVRGAVALAAGYGHTCAGVRGADGAPDQVWCWGDDRAGQLGRAQPLPDDPTPPAEVAPADLAVPGLRGLAARDRQTCAVHAEGVTCWGAPPTAPLAGGPAQPPTISPPTTRLTGPGWVAVSVGWGHACALAGGGHLSCWGQDDQGQLGAVVVPFGDPPRTRYAGGVRDAVGIAAGQGLSCAPRDGAPAMCWGRYTDVERRAAESGRAPLLEAPRRELRRQYPPGTTLTASAEEILGAQGARARVVIQTVDNETCANAQLQTTVERKNKAVRLKIGDPYLPGGDCVNAPAPASAVFDFEPGELGRRDLVIVHKGKEDFFQVYLREDKIEVLPLQATFVAWVGATNLWRVPAGSMAISCTDHLEAPLCVRRAALGYPTCRALYADRRVADVPPMADHPLASAWFSADPDAIRVSADFELESYPTLFQTTYADGSGCMDVRVRAWNGETWTNQGP